PLSLPGHQGRPDRWRPVRLRAGHRLRDLPADRSPTDAGWRPRMAFRRGPDARHRSAALSPRTPDLEGPRDPLVADHRPPGTVYGLRFRAARPAVIRNGSIRDADQAPIDDILPVGQDDVPLDGADVLEQGDVDPLGLRAARAHDLLDLLEGCSRSPRSGV